jgi:hypothetical protein
VALKGALENELFGHLVGSFGRCSIDLRRRVCTKYREIFFVGGIAKRHPKGASANFHRSGTLKDQHFEIPYSIWGGIIR